MAKSSKDASKPPAANPPVEGEIIESPPTAKPKEKKQDKGVLTQKDKRDINMAVRTEETRIMNPVEYEQIRIVSRDLVASEAIPACFQNVEQVMMALRHGFELGLTQVQALQSLYIVHGDLKLWGSAVPRQLRNNGWAFSFSDESPNGCTVTVKTRGRDETDPLYEEYTDTFTFQEAVDSGYTKDNKGQLKVGWRLGMNRKKKLRYGALGLIVSTYIPDALGAAVGIVEDDLNWQASMEAGPDAKEQRRAKMEAADEERKKLDNKNFKPTAVQTATEQPDDDTSKK